MSGVGSQVAVGGAIGGILVLLAVLGALKLSAHHRTTEPDEPGLGVPDGEVSTAFRFHPDFVAQLTKKIDFTAWETELPVVPPHEMPPVSPDPRRKES